MWAKAGEELARAAARKTIPILTWLSELKNIVWYTIMHTKETFDMKLFTFFLTVFMCAMFSVCVAGATRGEQLPVESEEKADAPKIAILYIATGRYIIFWDDFYQKAEQNFLPHYDKTYFVWTDDMQREFPKNVVRIYQRQLEWPLITLRRFDMFRGQAEQLKKYDYIYFLNANMLPVRPVGDEILPTKNQGLVVTAHPGYYKAANAYFPYDRNPRSRAYIPNGKGSIYAMGGFNGGRAPEYLKLIEECDKAVRKDAENHVMAKWHDESHLNKYILDKNPLVLPPAYAYPQEGYASLHEFKDSHKILILDKRRFGGHAYLRGLSEKPK